MNKHWFSWDIIQCWFPLSSSIFVSLRVNWLTWFQFVCAISMVWKDSPTINNAVLNEIQWKGSITQITARWFVNVWIQFYLYNKAFTVIATDTKFVHRCQISLLLIVHSLLGDVLLSDDTEELMGSPLRWKSDPPTDCLLLLFLPRMRKFLCNAKCTTTHTYLATAYLHQSCWRHF